METAFDDFGVEQPVESNQITVSPKILILVIDIVRLTGSILANGPNKWGGDT
jgi:hypothetical protein